MKSLILLSLLAVLLWQRYSWIFKNKVAVSDVEFDEETCGYRCCFVWQGQLYNNGFFYISVLQRPEKTKFIIKGYDLSAQMWQLEPLN